VNATIRVAIRPPVSNDSLLTGATFKEKKVTSVKHLVDRQHCDAGWANNQVMFMVL